MNITASTIKACKECGSTNLFWDTCINICRSIPQGRLNTTDVECLFFLGCSECSATLATVTADKIASIMTAETVPA